MHRAMLPPDLLHMYFISQEHFSLKRLLRELVSDGAANKTILYTRTAASLATTRKDSCPWLKMATARPRPDSDTEAGAPIARTSPADGAG